MGLLWPDENARLIAALFRDDPDGWQAGPHRARHRSGVEVWIANSSYALEVEIPGVSTLYGFFFPFGTVSQTYVWLAFKRWQRGRAGAALRCLTTPARSEERRAGE